MAEVFDADEYRNGGWKTAVEGQYTHYQRLGLNALGHIYAKDVGVAYTAREKWWKQKEVQRDRGGENIDIIREVGPFIKTARKNLQEASAVLSDLDRKSAYDRQIADHGAKANEGKLLDFIRFTLRDKILTPTKKNDLLAQAHELGISQERAEELIRQEMIKAGSTEGEDPSAAVLGRNSGTIPVVLGSVSPRLALNLTAISLGKRRKGEECVRTFIIDNLGGGILQGTIDVSHPEWMKVSQMEIDPRRHHQEVTVRVDTSNLALGTNHVGMVEVRSNGGRQGIRIDFSIELEASAVSRYQTRLFWSGLVVGGVFGLLLYAMAPSTLTRDAIAHMALLVGFFVFVLVGAKAGKWGGGIGTFIVAMFAQSIQYASMSAYSAAAWAMVVSAFLYFFARRLLVANLSGDTRPRMWAAVTGVGLAATIILTGVGTTSTARTQPNPHGTALPVEDKLAGSSIGQPTGIRWVHAFDDRGAVFSAADSSRIEYPGLIPLEGTLEFWIKVNSGYHYANSQFSANQDVAMIFSSDAQGGDVTWPGTTVLSVSRGGILSYRMATKMGDTSTMPIEARGTKFRFAEWHALGVSYGGQGEYIMLDGRVVASAPRRTQTFGQAGNHQEPLDIPTIGETVSHFWAHHRYEGGFEGVLAAFRVSAKQEDWLLAQGVKTGNTRNINSAAVPESRSSNVGLSDQPSGDGSPAQQTVDCNNLSLRLYNVDDSMQALLTNTAGALQTVLSASLQQDTGFRDISSSTRLGANTLTIQLTNVQSRYTYGYQLRSNSMIVDEGSCGTVRYVGCNNEDQKTGLVFTHTFAFQCSDAFEVNRRSDHGTILVDSATYGSSCNVPAGNDTENLAAQCNGRGQCAYEVSNARPGGDPASGCSKNYIAQYYCSRDPSNLRRVAHEVSKNEGYTISLNCGQPPREVASAPVETVAFQDRICNGADDGQPNETLANYASQDIGRFTVQLRPGCFSGYVMLPESWKSYTMEQAGPTENWWMAYKWYPKNSGRGEHLPLTARELSAIGTHTSQKIRVQGYGRLLFQKQ